MRLMPDSNPHFTEDEMQESVAHYFTTRKFRVSDPNYRYGKPIKPTIYREVRIPQIKRISDVIVYITDRRIINIECKLKDYDCVLRQAKDHLQWADYSYLCLPAETYLPSFILDEMITLGIGLLFWSPQYFIEVLQSGYNKSKDKKLRTEVLQILKRIDRVNTGKAESGKQTILVI